MNLCVRFVCFLSFGVCEFVTAELPPGKKESVVVVDLLCFDRGSWCWVFGAWLLLFDL